MKQLSPLTIALLAAAAALTLPLTGKAVIFTISGDDTLSAVFNRPTETGALSFQNPRFDAYTFTVDLSGVYSFGLVAADPANFDTYIHLYQTDFNPADPATNFLRANDDGPGGPDAGSVLGNVPLTAGASYFLVADGFSALDYGAYTATISGPGNIMAAAVPEPSTTWWAALGGLGGLFLLRRARRSASAMDSAH